jgi:MerR family mercuric resistance operon transcriptional regulator
MKLDAKGACTENRSLAASKLVLVEKKLVDLAKLRDVLRNLVAACDQHHGTSCPIIEQLESEQFERNWVADRIAGPMTNEQLLGHR